MRLLLSSLLVLLFILSGCKENKTAGEEVEPAAYTFEDLNEFIFVGMNKGFPSLYKYNFHTQTVKEFWSGNKEKVIEFSYSPDRKSAFFITAGSIGKEVLLHLNKAKIYVINNDSSVTFVEDAGDGIQIQARWETNNAFKILINKLEFTDPAKVIQHTRIYNSYGKLFEDEVRSYELMKEGYPQLYQDEPAFTSPNKNYSISAGRSDSLLLSFNGSENETFITATDLEIEKITWSPDQLFAAINLVDITRQAKGGSELIIYSIKEKKITDRWKRKVSGKYYIINDLLITDAVIIDKPGVILYNLNNNEPVDTITVKGGAGLSSLL